MITKEQACEYFNYIDGRLFWKSPTSHRIREGDEINNVDSRGYYRVGILNQKYRVHRIIFLMHHGYIPKYVDHINGDTFDNRIENLREADSAQNQWNSKLRCDNNSGYKGVSFVRSRGKWQAAIKCRGKSKFLGQFASAEDAIKAVNEARRLMHKNFCSNGVEPKLQQNQQLLDKLKIATTALNSVRTLTKNHKQEPRMNEIIDDALREIEMVQGLTK